MEAERQAAGPAMTDILRLDGSGVLTYSMAENLGFAIASSTSRAADDQA